MLSDCLSTAVTIFPLWNINPSPNPLSPTTSPQIYSRWRQMHTTEYRGKEDYSINANFNINL